MPGLFINIKIFLCVITCLFSMKETMETMFSIVFVMPVIQVKIMQHGSCQQCVLITVKRKHFVYLWTDFSDLFTVLIGSDIAMLDKFLHLLHMIICFNRWQYPLLLVLIIHILFLSPFSKKPFSLIKQSSHNVLIIAEYHVGENSIFRAAELTVEWTIDGLLNGLLNWGHGCFPISLLQ